MPKYEVEINGWLLNKIAKGEVSIVMDSAFITIDAENEDIAEALVQGFLDDDPLTTGMVDEITG